MLEATSIPPNVIRLDEAHCRTPDAGMNRSFFRDDGCRRTAPVYILMARPVSRLARSAIRLPYREVGVAMGRRREATGNPYGL
jgi:hypothetical protein